MTWQKKVFSFIGCGMLVTGGYYQGKYELGANFDQRQNANNISQNNDSIVKSHFSAAKYDQFQKKLSEMTEKGKAQELQRVADSLEFKSGIKLQAMEKALLKKDSLIALKTDTIESLKLALKALQHVDVRFH